MKSVLLPGSPLQTGGTKNGSVWAPKEDQGVDICPREGREQEALGAREEGEVDFRKQGRDTEANGCLILLLLQPAPV